MIIVRLMGGLGNQMFQYAVGRSLTVKHKTNLKLDLSFLQNPPKNITHRPYELNVFNIQSDIANKSEIDKFIPNNKILYNIKRITGLKGVIKEPHLHFYEGLLSAPDNSYLIGYWQSEKYFKEVEDIIRKDFDIKLKATGINQKMIEKINNYNSVSIHVRRGDYISNPKANKFHGTPPLEYYEKAIEKMDTHVDKPHFFVFSDDPSWTKDHLQFEYPMTFISHNPDEKSYEDLRLMSLCKHNIIANSTFSWWGAWLNQNTEKMVIVPKKWFSDPSINTNDIIPVSWIKI